MVAGFIYGRFGGLRTPLAPAPWTCEGHQCFGIVLSLALHETRPAGQLSWLSVVAVVLVRSGFCGTGVRVFLWRTAY